MVFISFYYVVPTVNKDNNNKKIILLKRKILLQILYLRRIPCKTTKKKRKYWVRKIYAERQTKGEYHLLVQDLKLHDQSYFLFAVFACHLKILKCYFPGLDLKLRR